MDIRLLTVTRLNDHLDEIWSFIDGLSDDQLRNRPSSGSWSMWEIIRHLFEVQETHVVLLTQMLVEERPDAGPMCLDNHAGDRHLGGDLRTGMKEFERQRHNLVSLLGALTAQHWQREANHPSVMHFTVEKCMEGLMRHEEYHLYELYRIFFGAGRDG
jgi:hypothetical protein